MLPNKSVIASIIIGLICSTSTTAMGASDENKAFEYGIILALGGVCGNNDYTAKAKLILKANDKSWEGHEDGLPERFPDAYKKGFHSVYDQAEMQEAEKIKLGTKYTNNKRRRICNKFIVQKNYQHYFKQYEWD